MERLLNAHNFKTPAPNDGYRIAAALLLEQKVCAVITLNFDLAMTSALTELGAGTDVAVIDGPHELSRQSTRNVYYLHRNANAVDLEDWVLRTPVLHDNWKNHWQQPITNRALAVPVVVFAGLGSPAAVLLESAKQIRTSAPNTARAFQVDPGDPAQSEFFAALALDPESYIRLGWCDFMHALADHVAHFQSNELAAAIDRHTQENAISHEDCSALVAWLHEIGLVKLGKLRARLLMADLPYEPDTAATRPLLADLLHVVAFVGRESGSTARLCDDGVVEFIRDGRPTSAFLLVSGRGFRGRVAVETRVREAFRQLRGRHCFPQGAIVAGSDWSSPISLPADIVNDDLAASIVGGQSTPLLYHVSELRSHADSIRKVAP